MSILNPNPNPNLEDGRRWETKAYPGILAQSPRHDHRAHLGEASVRRLPPFCCCLQEVAVDPLRPLPLPLPNPTSDAPSAAMSLSHPNKTRFLALFPIRVKILLFWFIDLLCWQHCLYLFCSHGWLVMFSNPLYLPNHVFRRYESIFLPSSVSRGRRSISLLRPVPRWT